MKKFKTKRRYAVSKLLILMMLFSQVMMVNGFAGTDAPQLIETVNASMPCYIIALNDEVYDNTTAEYPFITYKNILYLPLTNQNCAFLGIKSSAYFQIPTKSNTLFIGNADPTVVKLDVLSKKRKNPLSVKASIYDYKVALNEIASDEFFENNLSTYPVITYNDMTYLPLTWENVVEKLDWQYAYDSEDGFVLKTQDVNRPVLDDHIIGVQSPHSIKQYAIFEDIYMEYPQSTLGGHYEFVYKARGQSEVSINLQEQLRGGDYNFNRLADTNGYGHNKSNIEPSYENGVFSIACTVGTNASDGSKASPLVYKNYLLKIDLEKGEIIERRPLDLLDFTVD
ncbi:hypothetical protein [Fusibacter ferrireducens]|uniref:Uncharacterized protein n=1 Tax=Fusibacter ferrireducens TaxID=2785058 RepID=A0ABR9ZZU7_9FIRM|nr:hypothetical protein [Fusibacter ferrireducens]MBF4695967.1 hypothetical protein [Fusibacter ferrireducens]